MRFAKKGVNWEGRGWFLAPGLVVLAEQIETQWPEPQPGDGTVASKAHDATSPTSDHRPSPYDAQTGAIVRALDCGETSETITQDLVDALVDSKDSRIMYLIYEGASIWSVVHNGIPAWTWQDYNGPSPHEGHFHLSTKRTATADNDTRPWSIGVTDMAFLEPCKLGDTGIHVSALQAILYACGFYKGSVDGVYGAATSAAVLAMRKFRNSTATSGDVFSIYAHEQLLSSLAIIQVKRTNADIPEHTHKPGGVQ